MDATKTVLVGCGFLSILWLGSCAVIGAGTVFVVDRAATVADRAVAVAGSEVGKASDRIDGYVEKAEMDRWNEQDVTLNKTTHFENHHDF